ncbi:MAG: transcription factor, partial [Nitrososphaerota archaeon]|nr:transcription factor [Nitrososphaerota archaeon]
MRVEYEDSFVKIANLLGGEDYVKVARALLNNENATDEEIASATGLKINSVRKALYDLFGRSLISGIRVRDLKRGWFVYRWKAQQDQVDGFIETQKKKALDRLKQRLGYEKEHEFYNCGTPTCRKLTFEE